MSAETKDTLYDPLLTAVVTARDSEYRTAMRAVFLTPRAWSELLSEVKPSELFRDEELQSMGYDNFTINGVAMCAFGDLKR